MSEDAPGGARHGVPLQERLERYYRTRTDPKAQISDFAAISDGWETEVYAFTLTLRRQVERLILRLYPGADAAAKCERESHGMELLWHRRYPVPQVMRHETDLSWLGKPFLIMQKIEGRSLGQIMREQPERFPEWITRFCQLLVDLHRLDYRLIFGSYEAPQPAELLRRKFSEGRRLIVDQFRQAWAIPILDWLDAGCAEAEKTASLAVTHNDFHPNNILLTPENKAYVIDWSWIELSDYRFDLGWTLMLAASHGSQQERDLVLREYERLAGHEVEYIAYFEAAMALRRLFDFVVSVESGAESLGMRPEAVAIMRAQGERFRRVYALVQQQTRLTLPEIERLLDSL